MTFIRTVSEDQATDTVQELYARAKDIHGFVPNMVKIFSQRPGVMEAWNGLLSSVKAEMDVRRYELVTLAAANALRSSYCMLAHGSVLLKDFYTSDELRSIATDFRRADLDDTDVAIMLFAEQIVRDATSVTEADIELLRSRGLTDEEIFDVAAAAAIRCFFAKLVDALGGQPDSKYNDLEEDLRNSLTVGRSIEVKEF